MINWGISGIRRVEGREAGGGSGLRGSDDFHDFWTRWSERWKWKKSLVISTKSVATGIPQLKRLLGSMSKDLTRLKII